MTATATKTATARELAQAWSDTFQQHNLLATATADQRNAFIKRNIDTYNRLAAPVLDAPEQTNAQYFTPKLHANMKALMQAGGIHQQIAQKIALVFAACESIAEFTAPRLPSPRHAAAWTKNLIDDAKAIRFMLAQLEEQEARASVADQIVYERSNAAAAILAHLRDEEELAGGPARPSTVDMVEQYENSHSADLDDHAAEVGNAILCAAVDHIYRSPSYQLHNRTAGDALAIALMSGLRGMATRWTPTRNVASSVDYLYSYNPATHPAAVEEVGRVILQRAADHIYNRHPLGLTYGETLAVDVMDALREEEDEEAAIDPHDRRNTINNDPERN